MRTVSLISLALALGVAGLSSGGCGESTPDPKTAPPPAPTTAPVTSAPVAKEEPKKEEPKKEEPPPPPPPKTAKDVIVPGAAFMFSLADSPDAMKAVTEACGKKKKDEDKKKCEDDAKAAAAEEGIRFEKGEKEGTWAWVSFGKEKDKEVIYNKITIKDPKFEDKKVTFIMTGKDSGKRAMKFKDGDASPATELVDDTTVAMTDPKKGKLVFKLKK
jgi:type IV secretory pathway VirB10-like protein